MLEALKDRGRPAAISELAKKIEVDKRVLRPWLKSLRDAGRIELIGKGVQTKYRLVED